MDKKFRRSNESKGRWYSTGFTAGGVASVDAGKHILNDATVIRCGEAKTHGLWIDDMFCKVLLEMGNAAGEKGLKARFGHPNMCSEALGTFLGRWTGFKILSAEGAPARVCAALHLSSTAAESPKGDLRKYVEEMAAKEPQHFGASIVFTLDNEAMWKESVQNGAVEKEDEYGPYLDFSGYKSPDPANVENLPHARIAELHAADLVDDPAATDGMFSGAAGLSLAAQMTEWLDTHPDIFKALTAEPGLVNVVERYSDELKPFLSRYQENLSKKPAGAAQSAPASETATIPAQSAELQTRITTLETQASADKDQIAKLTGALSGAERLHAQALESVKTQTARADAAELQLSQANEATKNAIAERDAANSKLAAIEKGAAPLSGTPAETTKESAWKKAQKKK
jgi:uncharacterized coiled-coil protein SlyX